MRNEAKYICCIGGFIGFLTFFTVTLLLGEDALSAVLKGSVGCLFFSLCARGILHLVLSSLSATKSKSEETNVVVSPTGLNQEEAIDANPDSVVRDSAEAATAEAASDSPPTAAETVAA